MNKNNVLFLVFGSFNPPTKAHVAMSETLHGLYTGSTIDYVLAKDEYLTSDWKKQKEILDIETRAALLKGCINSAYTHVSTIEQYLTGNTYDTVRFYKRNMTNNVNLVFGADNLLRMKEWYRWEDLVRKNQFIIFIRNEQMIPPIFLQPYKEHFLFVDFNMDEYSSTNVREAAKRKDWMTVKKLVPKNVYLFLRRKFDD